MFGPLSLSLAPLVQSSKTLSKWVTPLAHWYANASRYRQYGFKYDDLVCEENPTVQRALGRLTDRESYDRAFRLKRASHASVLHAPIAKDQWTKPEEDVRYLAPHISNVAAEEAERQKWDSVVVKKH